MFIASFLNGVLSDQEKIESCFVNQFYIYMYEEYGASVVGECGEGKCEIDEDLFRKFFYESEEYESFNEVFDKIKTIVSYVLWGVILLLLINPGIVFLVNKNILQSVFELSFVGFLGSLFSTIYFRTFIPLQYYIVKKSELGTGIEEGMKDTILLVLECIFKDSLSMYFLVALLVTIILGISTVVFYFLNKKYST